MNSIFQEGVVRTNYSAKPLTIWLPLKEDQRLSVSQGAFKWLVFASPESVILLYELQGLTPDF